MKDGLATVQDLLSADVLGLAPAPDADGSTLHVAALHAHSEVVWAMLEAGEDGQARAADGSTASS